MQFLLLKEHLSVPQSVSNSLASPFYGSSDNVVVLVVSRLSTVFIHVRLLVRDSVH